METKQKIEKRSRILKEAITLFSSNGYSETTIAKVAKASGISFGSVFTYFPAKDELFKAALLEPLSLLKEEMFIPIDETLNYKESLKQLVKTHIEIMSRQEVYLRLIEYVLGQRERFPELMSKLQEFYNEFIEYMEEIVLLGQKNGDLRLMNAELISVSYITFMFGFRLVNIDTPDHQIWQKIVDYVLLLFAPTSLNMEESI